jgi:hypothetical protein
MADIFIRRPTLAIVLSILLVMLGLITLRGLAIEEYPSFIRFDQADHHVKSRCLSRTIGTEQPHDFALTYFYRYLVDDRAIPISLDQLFCMDDKTHSIHRDYPDQLNIKVTQESCVAVNPTSRCAL